MSLIYTHTNSFNCSSMSSQQVKMVWQPFLFQRNYGYRYGLRNQVAFYDPRLHAQAAGLALAPPLGFSLLLAVYVLIRQATWEQEI